MVSENINKLLRKIILYVPSRGVTSNPKEEGEVDTKEPIFDSSVAVMSLCNLKFDKK